MNETTKGLYSSSTPLEPEIAERMQLLTKKHAAELLDCSTSYINVLMNRGDLEPVRIGPKAVRITLESLRRFIRC